jgi:aspartate/glutamate racemase
MHIGLIGGIGPAATHFYYRRLISTFADKRAALELTIKHKERANRDTVEGQRDVGPADTVEQQIHHDAALRGAPPFSVLMSRARIRVR